MTTSKLRVLALVGLSALIGPIAAVAQEVHFTIPFSFTVGSKSFDAGDYRLREVAQHVLLIQSVTEQRKCLMVITSSAQAGNQPGKVTLTFHQYGEQRFLASMSDPNKGWMLPESSRERRLIAARASEQSHTLMASAHN